VWGLVAVVLGYPVVRAWTRRWENRGAAQIPSDVSTRLARIETAVDSIAVEIERIAENQRFLTKLQAERAPLASGNRSSEPPR
jgi:hypothetical protein